MDSLKDVFAHELKDLYSAENQIIKALPKMAKGAMNDELRMAFEGHLKETQMHVQRLEQVAEMCEITLRGQKCKGMEGLLEEGSELLSDETKNSARDAALIPEAQRVEHYEMAAYGSAVAFANMLGLSKAEALLQKTLNEEIAADVKLTKIAKQKVNPGAMSVMSNNGNGKAKNGKVPVLSGVIENGNASAIKTAKASSGRKS